MEILKYKYLNISIEIHPTTVIYGAQTVSEYYHLSVNKVQTEI